MVKYSKIPLFIVILTLCLPALMLCLPVMAQSTTGTIGGRVVDSQGAVVGGAAVTVTSTTTNVAHAAQTNHDGLYTVPLLQPGTYMVSVVTPNFRKEIRNNITIQIGQTLDLDFNLSVGATTETVTVTTGAPLVQTQSAAVGTVIDNQKVLEIPLNGREFYSLATLVPGVMPPVINSSLSYRGGFNVAGQNETSNYDTLDGINNLDLGISGPSVRPSVEDIQEFKLYSGETEAEYGHNIGGELVVTTKSGGNAFHGDIYEFIRNQIFDAKNYFTPPSVKLSLKRNDYGGTLGGPVIKNKMFFFFSFEGLRLSNQYVALATLPTTEQISGNFTGAAPLNIPTGYNPLAFAGNIINPALLTGPGQMTAYTVGKALLSYYPAVTSPTGSNYTYSAVNTEDSEVYGLRLDNAISAKDSTYVTLNYFNDPEVTPNNPTCASPLIPGFDCITGLNTQLYGGGWTHIFTPNIINTLTAGFQRLNQPRRTQDSDIPFDSTYGIPAFTETGTGYDNNVPNNQGIPSTAITGYQTFGGPTNLPQDRRDNTYDYLDTVLWNKGDHSFKFGIEYTRYLDSALLVSDGRGVFTFQGTYTGNPVADALLGLPTVATRVPTAPIVHGKQTYIAGFIEDSWKVFPNLTFNYGLRWEENTPFTSGNNQIDTFNLAGAGTPIVACANGVPCHVFHANNKDFGPRLGLSYRPFKNDGTVVQAGFGINYDFSYSFGNISSLETAYPSRDSETFDGTVAAPLSLPNPFSGNASVALNPVGISPTYKYPMNIGYTFGVEQKLGPNTVATFTYQGSETAHESNSYNINQATPQSTAAAGNAARPYHNWNTISYTYPRAHADYNALYVKLQQNLSHGLTFLASYTWGKAQDDLTTAQPQDIYNFHAEKGLSPFDTRNRFVASPVYQLPWGAGREYLTHGWVSDIVGDWEIAGQIAIQDGTPVTPILGANVSNNGKTTGDRPFVQGDPNSGPHHLGEWFNVFDYNYPNAVLSSFPGTTIVPPTPGPYGNARRDSINSPGYADADINIARNFVLPRKMSLQFRAEFFNALNHPQFGLPGATFTGFTKNATTGVVSAAGSFGQVTSANDGRDVQFALKLFY
jgi:hypothetical protein